MPRFRFRFFALVCLLSIVLRRTHSFHTTPVVVIPSPVRQPQRFHHLHAKQAEESGFDGTEIKIRDSLYGELQGAVDVIMQAFYADAKPPWNHMYRLAELNRLQQGFPYADRQLHRVLVAVAKQDGKKDQVIGYCDVDLRVPNQTTSYKFNPRPYLSDLCISPTHRRQGIAKKMVTYCEEYCQSLGKREIFIRVERANLPAVQMYTDLGYQEFDNHLDDSEKIIILRKCINREEP